jgi:hypothetical protein
MRCIDFVPSRKNHASAGSQILPVWNNNKEERNMLMDSKAFGGRYTEGQRILGGNTRFGRFAISD